MDETMRVVVGVAALVVLLGALGLVVAWHFRKEGAIWRGYAASRGGVGRSVIGVRTNASYTRDSPLGRIQVDQWSGGGTSGAGAGHFQWIVTLRLGAGTRVPAFFLGDDAWASAFAGWAHKLSACDGLGPDAVGPRKRGRSELGTLQWWNDNARTLAHELQCYVAFGKDQLITAHVPGRLGGPRDYPRMDAAITLVEEVARSAGSASRGT